MNKSIWHSEDSKEFLCRWNEICDGRPLPDRGDFTPKDFQPYLSQMVIIDCEKGDRMSVRLAGTEVVNRCGGELTGESIEDLLSSEQMSHISVPLSDAIRENTGCRMIGHVSTSSDHTWNVEFTFLPYRQESTGATRLMGYLAGSCQRQREYETEVELGSIRIEFCETLTPTGLI